MQESEKVITAEATCTSLLMRTKLKMTMTKLFIVLLLKLLFIERSEQINLGNACQAMWDAPGNNPNMWHAAGNNLITTAGLNQELTVNVPAPNPLFSVQPEGGRLKITSLPFRRLRDLLRDYENNPPNPQQANIDAFLSNLTQPGGPVEAAFQYLHIGHFLPQDVNTLQQFRNLLEDKWFTNSHGFQHVFVGERYVDQGQNRYKGFHNWFQFFVEQQRGQTADIHFNNAVNAFAQNTRPPFLRGLRFTWRGLIKNAQAGSSMFVGTSPAFDLAMFSTCFIRGNEGATNCDCQINAGGVVSNVQMTAVKRQGKVVTAYPRNVIQVPPG